MMAGAFVAPALVLSGRSVAEVIVHVVDNPVVAFLRSGDSVDSRLRRGVVRVLVLVDT